MLVQRQEGSAYQEHIIKYPHLYLFFGSCSIFNHRKLGRIQRNSLWDAADGARKFHLVWWEPVMSPRR